MKVAAITRLKNGVLYEAAEKMGSQSALARHLGVNINVMCNWFNMKGAPPTGPTQHWDAERIKKLEEDLFELTGMLLEDIFPEELRDKAFQSQSKVRVQYADVEIARLEDSSPETLMIDCDPSDAVEKQEMVDVIARILPYVQERDAYVLKHRFGLDGEEPKTLQEIGDMMGISRDRVRQIEARALNEVKCRIGDKL